MKIKEYFLNLRHFRLNYYRTIHVFKTAMACLFGLLLEKYYAWPTGQWVPITIMVVMSAQMHFGGALRKAYMRLLGTVSGVAITISVLWFFNYDIAVVAAAVFVSCAIFTYVASSHGDISYAGTLGGVTVILILGGSQASIETALQRGFYIVVGIVIALLVSRFIFPIHARDRLRYHIVITLRNLRKLYFQTKQVRSQKKLSNADIELSDAIATDISCQPHLINEASAGSIIFAEKKGVYVEIVNCEHRINRLINLMSCSLSEIEFSTIDQEQLTKIEKLHAVVEDALDYLADCFENTKDPKEFDGFDEKIAAISEIAGEMPITEGQWKVVAEHSFLFFIEQIFKELKILKGLILEANGKNKANVV